MSTSRSFELLIISVPGVAWQLHDIVNNGSMDFADILYAISSHICLFTVLLMEQHGLEAELSAHIDLTNGLHCIFSSYVQGRPSFELIRHGMDLIEETQDLITQMPRSGTILFRTAHKMCEMLRVLDSSDTPAFMAAVTTFYRWFKAHLKFIKWRVHESHISGMLRAKGILHTMTKASIPRDANLDRYRIINTFEVADEAEGGYYLL
jgi:hypothetical protein